MSEDKEKPGFDVSALVGETLRVWVPFNKEIRVELNYVSREEIADIRGACTKKEWDRRHQPIEELDNVMFSEKLGLKAINNWTGPEAHGAPLLCTPENIKLFMRKWLAFAAWIAETATDLERLVEAEKENVRKNSEPTSGRETTTLQ